ncbi:tRNA (cytosine-5-)-methyltransferase [Entomortierella beljakovae]|nr:tRNA (cytosine-5-)-methyltransferase [Entomortierella beljakovae]
MNNPPNYILLENVKGFEESDSRDILVESLTGAGYEYQELLITPLQLGIPNSRMRYYCLARKTAVVGSFVQKPTGTLIGYIPSLEPRSDNGEGHDDSNQKDFIDGRNQGDLSGLSTPVAAKKRKTSLTTSTVTKENSEEGSEKPNEDAILADPMLALKVDTLEKFIEFKDKLPEEVAASQKARTNRSISRKKSCNMSLNTTSDRSTLRTGYYHFVESTGSIFQMETEKDTASIFDEAEMLKGRAGTPTEAEDNAKALTLLHTLGLRYFTENEVAQLMGFPITEGKFSFPATTSLKQRYRVLGNSINVKVVSQLIRYLLTSKSKEHETKADNES